ncbi:hypothetical protein Tco_0199563 [Tanacetum coccineum]
MLRYLKNIDAAVKVLCMPRGARINKRGYNINNTNNINTASDGNITNNINAVSSTINAAGLEVNVDLQCEAQKEDGLFISQDKYVTEILKKFSFSDVKIASTPMETHKTLLKDEDGKDVNEHLYRSMIGSLMYLTSLRPDIMFSSTVLCLVFNKIPMKKKHYLDDKDSHRSEVADLLYTIGIWIVSRFSNIDCNMSQGSEIPTDSHIYHYSSTITSKPRSDSLEETEEEINLVKLQRITEFEETEGYGRVGRFTRVVSFKDEGLGDQEDASKQGRKIDEIDQDAEVTLVDETQGSYSHLPNKSAKFYKKYVDELTLAQTLIEIKAAKPKARGVIVQEPTELDAELEEEEKLTSQREKDANIAEWDDVQAIMDVDYELATRLQAEKKGELTIEEKSRLFVELMNKRKRKSKHFALNLEQKELMRQDREDVLSRAGEEIEYENFKEARS